MRTMPSFRGFGWRGELHGLLVEPNTEMLLISDAVNGRYQETIS